MIRFSMTIVFMVACCEAFAGPCADMADQMSSNYENFGLEANRYNNILVDLNTALKLNDRGLINYKEFQKSSMALALKDRIIRQISTYGHYQDIFCNYAQDDRFGKQAEFMRSYLTILNDH